jgi:hypothetical protein
MTYKEASALLSHFRGIQGKLTYKMLEDLYIMPPMQPLQPVVPQK